MRIIEQIYQHYIKSHTISTDSRNITEGCVFVALKGERFDGNDFAYQVASENVASCVIADRKDLPSHERIFIVDDSLAALQELARLHREKCNIPVIGITGTNGKTTTKELVAAVLSEKKRIIYTQGNFNNHLGVPLTLLRIKPETEMAVVEIGANHPGEIAQLCNIAKPDYGIVTNIGRAHIEGFGSYEGIIKTKNELYEYIKENGTIQKSKAFVNSNNELLVKLTKEMDCVYYGSTDDCNTYENIAVGSKAASSSPYLVVNWDGIEIKTNLVGDYNLENVMAAIAVGSYFNIEKKLIVKALENYLPSNNRSQYIKSSKNEIVMDAYNANPTSMAASIRNFRNISNGNSLLILGDMKELGNESEKEHRIIIDIINELKFEDVILVGDEFKKVNTKFQSFSNIDDLIKHIDMNSISGKNILVKGSHSIHLERLINIL